ncbi:MAG: MFS transporter [Isosphaeraceae bacterium]
MLGLGRPELRAWAMYDWANSAMMTTIISAVFPIYFSDVAAANLSRETATLYFAIASTAGMVVIALLSPILGAFADERPIKKRMLASFMALGVAAVGGMFFIHDGDWVLASMLFIVANIGANGSFVFYDALLPHIARGREMDRVSSAGYALGYLGGGILLTLNLAWILHPGWFGLPSGAGLTADQKTLPARLSFLSVAIWWSIFSVPLFRVVREPGLVGEAVQSAGHPLKVAFTRLGETFRELRRYRQGFLMLLAFLVYNDGIGTIFRMATIYGREIGITQDAMISALVIVQFVGIPFAFLFGFLASWVGAKRSILFSLVVYTGISVLARFMSTATHFYLLAILVGMVQGGSQALSRSLFASLIPRDRSGEFFGFFGVVEKFAGIFGPLMFAASLSLGGSSRYAILSVIGFFAVGGGLLALVDVEAGQQEAREAEGLAGRAPRTPTAEGP